MSNLWEVSSDKFTNEKDSIMRTGNIYQIANGYMGCRGTLDEFGPEELVGITLAGIFDQVGDAWREPVNAPNGGFTAVTLDGAGISALSTAIKSHRQSLDLRNAVFKRETAFESGGKTLKIESTRYLSAETPNLGVIHYALTCNQAARIRISTGIDCRIWDLNGPHLKDLSLEHERGVLTVQAVTNEARKKVAVAEAIEGEFGKETVETKGNRLLRVIEFDAEPGRTYAFSKYFAVFTDNDRVAATVKEAAVRCVQEARARGYEKCLAAHDAEWEKKWRQADVVIDGDDEAQLALRYSIFQLLIVAPVKDSGNSIPARALSGQVYKGAIFWDTEMFMLPFFLHTDPEKAVELMRYRIKTLDGARRKARTEGSGYRGAFYAWESQETGDDACSYFNIGDPITKRDLRTYFRDKQVHISGDVVMAMWEYFRLTGDDTLLREGGAEVILECARFYYSYAYFKKDKNRYEILDVTGPDEYHERVNNDAYTNMVAKVTFEIALAAADHLRRKYPAEFAALVAKINVAEELPLFAEAAKLLYVPQPDAHTGIIEQFDGYHKLKNTPIKELKAQLIHPNEYLGGGQGLAVPTQVIKQADVVLMLNVFKDRYLEEVKSANWKYYEPRTEHGSSLSACAYAMVAVDIGKPELAYKYFLATAKVDLEGKSKIYAGTIFIGGSHPAANGGAWMTAIFGFAGLRAGEEQVNVNPKLYQTWKSIHFNLVYRGDRFNLSITRNEVAVKAEESNRCGRVFVIWGKPVDCAPGKLATVKYP